MRRRVLLLALLALANASPPVRLQVQPKIAQAPSDVHLKIFVARHSANRRLDIAIEGENFSTANSRQLDGEDAPGVFDVWFKGLPCGHYTAAVQVARTDENLVAHDTFTFVGCDE